MRILKRTLWHHIKLFSELLFSLLGFFVFIGLKVIEPLVKIRVGKLGHDRIGHLAANTELFLRRQSRSEDSARELHIFLAGKPANHQLLAMIKRRLHVFENRILLKLHNSIKPYTRDSKVWINLPFDTNEYEEFNNVSPQLSFAKEEEIQGTEMLTRIGIENGAPFVCFHARDKAYLDIFHPRKSRKEWSYHDFRDCDINNYLSAAEYLANQEIYAIRMGAIVEKKIFTTNNHIIDYATRFRSDFGDIYLPSKCKFFLGNTSGNRLISTIFNIPIAFANSVPLGVIALGKNDLFIPKKYWSTEKKRLLTFREIIKIGADWWLKGEMFVQAGIEIIENSADEILALTKEMNERLDGACIGNDEDEELQRQFRSLFSSGHRCYGFPSRIGAEFLRQNRELLEEGNR